KHLARRNEIAFVNEDFPDPAGAPRRDVNFDGLNASIPAGDPRRMADVCISFPSIVAGHGQNEGESRRQPPLYDRLHWCRTLWRASGWARLCYSSRRIADRLSKIEIDLHLSAPAWRRAQTAFRPVDAPRRPQKV